jgi:hypothetical protein
LEILLVFFYKTKIRLCVLSKKKNASDRGLETCCAMDSLLGQLEDLGHMEDGNESRLAGRWEMGAPNFLGPVRPPSLHNPLDGLGD